MGCTVIRGGLIMDDEKSRIKIVIKGISKINAIVGTKDEISISAEEDAVCINIGNRRYKIEAHLLTLDEPLILNERIKWAEETAEDLQYAIDDIPDYDGGLTYTISGDLTRV